MFKTIKSKVIFVTIFSIICICITLGLIMYKNIEIDEEYQTENINNQILRLMMIENSGNHSYFFNEAKALFDEEKKDSIKNIIKLEVRKHLLCNTYLPIDKKHKTIDYFFGSASRKNFLTIPKKK